MRSSRPWRLRGWATSVAVAVALPVGPEAALGNPLGCGGDAFSSAEVHKAPPGGGPRRRGKPITAAPDTLCPDLSDDRPETAAPNLDVMIAPPGEDRAAPLPRSRRPVSRPGGRP